MLLQLLPSVALAVASFLVAGVVAPIPPCSPLRFVNWWVESESKAWLFRDLPGHPVGPCQWKHWKLAPPEEKSLIAFFSQPGKIAEEVERERVWWKTKGFPRITDRIADKLKKLAGDEEEEEEDEEEDPTAFDEVVDADDGAAAVGNFFHDSAVEDEEDAPLVRKKRFAWFFKKKKRKNSSPRAVVVDYDSPDFRVEHTFHRDRLRGPSFFAAYDDQRDRSPRNYFFDTLLPRPSAEFAPQPVYGRDGVGGFGGGGPEFAARPAGTGAPSAEFAARPTGGGVHSAEFSARPAGASGRFKR